MNSFAKWMLVAGGLAVVSLAACGKKSNCPTYWAEPDNQQKASDGKKSAGENLSPKDEKREIEFSAVRVKRDKNGVVEKKQPKKPKKKTY